MITPEFVQMMARYNAWQNRSLIEAAEAVGDEARSLPRGAFFGSIAATFNHLYWADSVWMSRFAGWEKPPGGIRDSVNLFPDWAGFVKARAALDTALLAWSETVDPAWLAGTMTWFSGSSGREVSRAHGLLVAHFFNHQTHHRGQIHAMLTAAGARPDDTDLFHLPDRA